MRRAAAVFFAALAGCGGPQQVSDWERANPDLLESSAAVAASAAKPPAFPRSGNLTEIYISATATFRYFVDRSSLDVQYQQREIRYVLLARSPSGVENVSYEAIKCPDMHRIYAVGAAGGKWVTRGSDWQQIQRTTALTVPHVLARQFFCPHRDPLQSVAEGVDALQRGAHPLVYVEERPGPSGR